MVVCACGPARPRRPESTSSQTVSSLVMVLGRSPGRVGSAGGVSWLWCWPVRNSRNRVTGSRRRRSSATSSGERSPLTPVAATNAVACATAVMVGSGQPRAAANVVSSASLACPVRVHAQARAAGPARCGAGRIVNSASCPSTCSTMGTVCGVSGDRDRLAVDLLAGPRPSSRSPMNSWMLCCAGSVLGSGSAAGSAHRRVAAHSRQRRCRLMGSRRRQERHSPVRLRPAKSRQARQHGGCPAMLDAQAWQCAQEPTAQSPCAQRAQR
jgi:hypothetical protein